MSKKHKPKKGKPAPLPNIIIVMLPMCTQCLLVHSYIVEMAASVPAHVHTMMEGIQYRDMVRSYFGVNDTNHTFAWHHRLEWNITLSPALQEQLHDLRETTTEEDIPSTRATETRTTQC